MFLETSFANVLLRLIAAIYDGRLVFLVQANPLLAEFYQQYSKFSRFRSVEVEAHEAILMLAQHVDLQFWCAESSLLSKVLLPAMKQSSPLRVRITAAKTLWTLFSSGQLRLAGITLKTVLKRVMGLQDKHDFSDLIAHMVVTNGDYSVLKSCGFPMVVAKCILKSPKSLVDFRECLSNRVIELILEACDADERLCELIKLEVGRESCRPAFLRAILKRNLVLDLDDPLLQIASSMQRPYELGISDPREELLIAKISALIAGKHSFDYFPDMEGLMQEATAQNNVPMMALANAACEYLDIAGISGDLLARAVCEVAHEGCSDVVASISSLRSSVLFNAISPWAEKIVRGANRSQSASLTDRLTYARLARVVHLCTIPPRETCSFLLLVYSDQCSGLVYPVDQFSLLDDFDTEQTLSHLMVFFSRLSTAQRDLVTKYITTLIIDGYFSVDTSCHLLRRLKWINIELIQFLLLRLTASSVFDFAKTLRCADDRFEIVGQLFRESLSKEPTAVRVCSIVCLGWNAFDDGPLDASAIIGLMLSLFKLNDEQVKMAASYALIGLLQQPLCHTEVSSILTALSDQAASLLRYSPPITIIDRRSITELMNNAILEEAPTFTFFDRIRCLADIVRCLVEHDSQRSRDLAQMVLEVLLDQEDAALAHEFTQHILLFISPPERLLVSLLQAHRLDALTVRIFLQRSLCASYILERVAVDDKKVISALFEFEHRIPVEEVIVDIESTYSLRKFYVDSFVIPRISKYDATRIASTLYLRGHGEAQLSLRILIAYYGQTDEPIVEDDVQAIALIGSSLESNDPHTTHLALTLLFVYAKRQAPISERIQRMIEGIWKQFDELTSTRPHLRLELTAQLGRFYDVAAYVPECLRHARDRILEGRSVDDSSLAMIVNDNCLIAARISQMDDPRTISQYVAAMSQPDADVLDLLRALFKQAMARYIYGEQEYRGLLLACLRHSEQMAIDSLGIFLFGEQLDLQASLHAVEHVVNERVLLAAWRKIMQCTSQDLLVVTVFTRLAKVYSFELINSILEAPIDTPLYDKCAAMAVALRSDLCESTLRAVLARLLQADTECRRLALAKTNDKPDHYHCLLFLPLLIVTGSVGAKYDGDNGAIRAAYNQLLLLVKFY